MNILLELKTMALRVDIEVVSDKKTTQMILKTNNFGPRVDVSDPARSES